MTEAAVVLNPGVGGDSIRAEQTANGKQQVVTLADAAGNLLGTGPAPLPVAAAGQPNLVGVWAYLAGVSGSVSVPASARVVGITAHCTTAGSMTINGGPSVPIPANTAVVFAPNGQLVAPVIVFTGTDSYLIETVT